MTAGPLPFGRRPAKQAALWLLLLFLAACLRLEFDGGFRSDGHWIGSVRVFIPAHLALNPDVGPLLRGPEQDVARSWQAAGATVDRDPQERQLLHVRARDIRQLDLPWLRFAWQREGSRFHYRHDLRADPAVMAQIEARMTRQLSGTRVHDPGFAEGMARLSTESAGVEIRHRFPGPVTATNGERIDARTVAWTLSAADLRAGGDFPGWASGETGLWQRWTDPLRTWFDEL